MSDDQQRRNERFQQALDDMFGPASSEPEPIVVPPVVTPAPEPEPVAVSPPVTARPAGSSPVQPSYSAPVKSKRSLRRTLALGCAGVFGLLFLCLVALAVIGFITDEDEGASAVNEPVDVFAPAAEPSYTAGTGGETPAGVTPMGAWVEISPDWRVAVVGVTPDATDLVMAENQFNDPPGAGRQFFMAMVSVESTGAVAEAFPAGVLFRAVNEDGREYTTFDDYCGVVPDMFPYDSVPAGEVVSGNVCWSVIREDADSIVMRSIAYLDGFDQHHFSLQQ